MVNDITKFDIIDNVGNAFQRTWEERAYLARLALVPIVIKMLCYYAAFLYVEPQDILRLSLFMLPAYFAEGWMMAHWARTIMTDHRWPFVPSGNLSQDRKEIDVRSKGIISGAVAFTAVNFFMAGFFAAVFSVMPPDLNPENADPALGTFALLVIFTMFFLFRFTWLYIPMSVGISFKKYVTSTNRILFTFRLIALWLVCFIPPIILMQIVGGLMVGAEGEAELTTAMEVVLAGVRVVFDTLKNILVTAGIAYALMEVFQWQKK